MKSWVVVAVMPTGITKEFIRSGYTPGQARQSFLREHYRAEVKEVYKLSMW